MLSKSYSLLNFLNRSHSPAFRYGVGGAAYAGTFAVTGRPSIARLVRTQFVQDETKYAFRLAGWVLRRGWPGVETVTDDFFDFTLGREPGRPRGARGVHRRPAPRACPSTCGAPTTCSCGPPASTPSSMPAPATSRPLRADFREHADALLPLISTAQGEPSGPVSDREGDFSVDDAAHRAARPRRGAAGAAVALVRHLGHLPRHRARGRVPGPRLRHRRRASPSTPSTRRCSTALVEALERSPRYVVKKLDDAQTVVETEPGRYAVERAPALVKLIHENGINVDVFVHHREGDRLWHGSSIHRWENTRLRARRLHAGRRAGARPGRRRPLPHRELRRLAHARSPSSTARPARPNLVISRTFRSVALFLTRLAHFAHGDPAEYAKLRATLVADGMLRDEGGVLRLERDI